MIILCTLNETIKNMKHSAQTMSNHYGVTGQHPDFPVEDWVAAVAQYDTRQGYWDWVAAELKNANGDFIAADDSIHGIQSRLHDFYTNVNIATVNIINGGIDVLGGNRDNRRLKTAKTETSFCHVKVFNTDKSVKLLLIDKKWVLESIERGSAIKRLS